MSNFIQLNTGKDLHQWWTFKSSKLRESAKCSFSAFYQEKILTMPLAVVFTP